MYTEGYIAEIRVEPLEQKTTMTFWLEPAAPYQFRNGETTCTVTLEHGPIPKDKKSGQCNATVHFTKRLELTCEQGLADFASLVAIKAYDVWQEKNMYGKKTMGVVRTTYLIENGIITKAFGKVKAADNPNQMLQEL